MKDPAAVKLGRRGGKARWRDVPEAERADRMREVVDVHWMNEAERLAGSALRELLGEVLPHDSPTASYDFVFRGGPRPLFIEVKPDCGRRSVVVRLEQYRRLVALGDAAYWLNGTLLPVAALFGIAHVHRNARNPTEKTVLFRVLNGRAVSPYCCLGPCEGPLVSSSPMPT